MLADLTHEQLFERIGHSVFFHMGGKPCELSDELLAQVIRRAAQVTAPCTKQELVSSVVQSFSGIVTVDEQFTGRIEHVTEDLIVFGDILEMRAAPNDLMLNPTGFILRPAPPSFVARRDGSLAILGIAGDYITPLTAELERRVVVRGALRIMPATDGEDTQTLLRELGLLKLSEKAWLRLPTVEAASTHIASWRQQVANELPAAGLDGVRILDTSRSPTFYNDRWCEPAVKHTGLFIARRPQRYGAALWCVAEVEKGVVRRFKDLSAPGDKLRPFDLAWRIQAAFDSNSGMPQRYRCSDRETATTTLRFFSPIPSWCERHLSVVGHKTKADRCLFSFDIPTNAVANELKLLHETLWMTELLNDFEGRNI
jgi:hypothetical protein